MQQQLPIESEASQNSTLGDSSAPSERLIAAVLGSWEHQTFSKLVFSSPRATKSGLNRVSMRPLLLQGQLGWSCVYSHDRRDVSKNVSKFEGLREMRQLMAGVFSHAHLITTDGEWQWRMSRRGQQTLFRGKTQATQPASVQHNREKKRWVQLDRPYLRSLGVTDAQQQLISSMSRKWKQINKFVEVFDGALKSWGASKEMADRPVRVADFGSGKAYLTFAVHDHLCNALGMKAHVTGVELRGDLVGLCRQVVDDLGLTGLTFDEGDVRHYPSSAWDVLIALHACDVATDHAIHLGIRSGASIIMCSPCCHKQIRPQLLSPQVLRPIFKHGVHLGQEAEMLTDGLRALLLEAHGYETQVFEFISLEHTPKNKMILAVKRPLPGPVDAVWDQIRDIKSFYGITQHCLETLLQGKT